MTQPWATLIAGCLAVIAATIALWSVLYTQKVAKASTRAQLRQQYVALLRQQRQHAEQIERQQREHAEQIEAATAIERDKHRREASMDAFRSAISALEKLKNAFVAATHISENSDSAGARDYCIRAADECTLAATMLLLFDLQDSYLAVLAPNLIVRKYLAGPPRSLNHKEIHEFTKAHTDAVGALRVDCQKVMGSGLQPVLD